MGRGKCDDGSLGSGECVCEHGYFGVACHLQNQPGGETGTSNLMCPDGNYVAQQVSFMRLWQAAGHTRTVEPLEEAAPEVYVCLNAASLLPPRPSSLSRVRLRVHS